MVQTTFRVTSFDQWGIRYATVIPQYYQPGAHDTHGTDPIGWLRPQVCETCALAIIQGRKELNLPPMCAWAVENNHPHCRKGHMLVEGEVYHRKDQPGVRCRRCHIEVVQAYQARHPEKYGSKEKTDG